MPKPVSNAPLRQALGRLANLRGLANRGPRPGRPAAGDQHVTVLSEIRRTLPSEFVDDLITALHRDKILSGKFSNGLCPATPFPLYHYFVEDQIGLRRELKWAGAFLLPYRDLLNSYLRLSLDYQSGLLSNNYLAAAEALDQLQEKVGYSHWLVGQRLAMLQASEGLEAQKAIAAELVKQCHRGGISAYIIHNVSARTETAVDAGKYWDRMSSRLNGLKASPRVRVLLRYYLLPGVVRGDADLAMVLSAGPWGSLVDYYESLLYVARILIAQEKEEYFPNLARSLASLDAWIEDPRLTVLSVLCGGTTPKDQTLPAVGVARAFLSHGESFSEGSADHLSPSDESFEVIARSQVCTETGTSIGAKLSSALRTVLTNPASAQDERSALLRTSFNHFGMPWADALVVPLCDNPLLTPGPLREPAALASRIVGVPSMNPMVLMRALSPSLVERHLKAFRSLSNHGEWVDGFVRGARSDLGESAEVDPALLDIQRKDIGSLFTLRSAERHGAHDAALIAARALLDSDDALLSAVGAEAVVYAQLRDGRVAEAVYDTVRLFLANETLRAHLPTRAVVSAIDLDAFRGLSGRIELSILYDIFARSGGIGNDAERAYSVELFLISRGVSRPAELRERIDDLTSSYLTHFLRFCCTETVLDRVQLFSAFEEVLEERLKICSWLRELDAKNAPIYEDEIKAIRKRLLIEQRVREIERSKIYVDVEAVKREATASLVGTFRRYQSLIKGMGEPAPGLSEEVAEALDDFLSGRKQTIELLPLPPSESNDAFKSLVLDLRDLYTSGELFGLDTYLSLRIRHGTFAATLRSSLEPHGLVTTLHIPSQSYGTNTRWHDKLKLPEEVGEPLGQRIAEFSREFDELVATVLRSWVQIKRVPGDPGLFDFFLNDATIRLLREYAHQEVSFDDLVNFILTNFTQILEQSLSTIRNKLTSEIKPAAINMLLNLEADVRRLNEIKDVTPILTAITTARSDLQNTFDRVTQWFQLSAELATEPFSVSDAITVSVESVQTLFPTFKITQTGAQTLPTVKQGLFFASFVDILFIVFENIVQHSGFESGSSATVSVTAQKDVIQFDITNPVKREKANAEARADIKARSQAIQEGTYLSSLRREGGTGIFKICRIMRHEFGIEPTLNVAFVDHPGGGVGFNVQFQLPIDILAREA